ncbi:MAG: nicotinate phosphoribosyltransferase [Deltaproteobacteria bacterium]|nr:nicotinate phosphoribosyltransferase [Deltaproteobacteria bacterium]
MFDFKYSPLLTDLYELTMMAGFFRENMHEKEVAFDLFFRKNPFHSSYAVFAGLEPALKYLTQLRFSSRDIDYLRGLGIFQSDFLAYLADFRFQAKVTAPQEGTAVFANEPLLTVEGKLAEVQLVETALLNIINFQTLVATKAARIKTIAGKAQVLEFGLRRAHGPDGGLSEARAAYIGGVRSTSNVWAGQLFGIPVKGTHAHSWIMAFPDELSSFRAYAECFPDSCILLIDTYDTLKSGLPNALIVARELRAKGHELAGIRLDSGDLAYLSKKVRDAFDQEGFPEVKIVASSELDEYVIQSIRSEGGTVDIYGVGTKLATCMGPGGGALGGVYKLVRFEDSPKLKVTSDIAKATLPDRKVLYRVIGSEGNFEQDVICRENETVHPGDIVYDPTNPLRYKKITRETHLENIRCTVMDYGKILLDLPPLEKIADHCQDQLSRLPEGSLRLENPHIYKVSMSRGLYDLRSELMAEYEKNFLNNSFPQKN